MTFTDPIGDMFSRIRNGQMRSLNSVEIPSSNFRKNILEILKNEGFSVENTKGENLDFDYSAYTDTNVDLITSFEIFEHMLAPFNILRELKTDKLIASVPLKLWFTDAYWNDNNDWDKHYHEFEIKQFNFLLKQTGWVIKDFETWTSSDWRKIGIRPILRHFTPRYYIVYCEKTNANKI